MKLNDAELVLIKQALREAASYTRVAERRLAYLLLAGKVAGPKKEQEVKKPE